VRERRTALPVPAGLLLKLGRSTLADGGGAFAASAVDCAWPIAGTIEAAAAIAEHPSFILAPSGVAAADDGPSLQGHAIRPVLRSNSRSIPVFRI
jgi:hypothetical protein